MRPVGQGTERIEEKLAELFPGVSHVRLDRDACAGKGDVEAAVRRMATGEARILIGTQMVTKGHDFPNVTLVVVLNADRGLFSTDFRAPERLAQTIVQVAGRAGRGERPGEVLIQTEFPDHPLLQSLLAEGYEGFARTALIEREQAAWPPYSRLAAVRASAKSAEAALAISHRGAPRCACAPSACVCSDRCPPPWRGAPAAITRSCCVESRDRGALQRFLGRLDRENRAAAERAACALGARRRSARAILAARRW